MKNKQNKAISRKPNNLETSMQLKIVYSYCELSKETYEKLQNMLKREAKQQRKFEKKTIIYIEFLRHGILIESFGTESYKKKFVLVGDLSCGDILKNSQYILRHGILIESFGTESDK